ncbi:formate dehydrogenase accessory sulfurtransferase FdhD [Roseomonas elaeocarpi]|uniref:Sulfur carrier protein FdhD n=1 Tax=Roseomonas elaeocarpi TaxID=907779 RepID=A0ABV6JQY8_9PROT
MTAAFHRFREGTPPAALLREVAVEAPVSLVYSGVPFAVMMATPCDLEDFALGFSLTEGIVENTGDLRGTEVGTDEDGNLRVDLTLTGTALRRHLARQRGRPGRVITGRTGCGICGVEDAGDLPWAAAPGTEPPVLHAASVRRALDALEDAQRLNRRTNAVHAAAWVALDGALLLVREDVGRHNALDKLVGAVARAGLDRLAGFVLVTSRCSYEMVEKTAVLGARALVSISLPTSLALERARALDMTLVAGARGGVLTVFHGADRVTEMDLPPS